MVVLVALFGCTMGMGVVNWTCGMTMLTFMQTYSHVPLTSSYVFYGIGTLLPCPLFVLWGYLSDHYGRKPFVGLADVDDDGHDIDTNSRPPMLFWINNLWV
jgi:MFS family permease